MKTLSFYSIWEDGFYNGTMTKLLKDYGLEAVEKAEDADVLVFNGGADIATEIYGEAPVFRGIPQRKSHRDKTEIALYDEFVGSKFMFGICRGAQLLNCLNGGTLWQHVNNHGRDHEMIDLTTKEVMMITSTHHQMMRPTHLGQIIGVSNVNNSREAEEGHMFRKPASDISEGQDVEVVWYPNTRCLCIQGHPEYVPGSRFADWSFNLMQKKYEERLICAA